MTIGGTVTENPQPPPEVSPLESTDLLSYASYWELRVVVEVEPIERLLLVVAVACSVASGSSSIQ
jgi:hypothetical protein